MPKKIVFSAKHDHVVIKTLIKSLQQIQDVELILHDPTKNFFYLSRMPKKIKEADLIIVKVRNDCSIDLLHFANLYNIPTLHDVETILICKNKIALDYALRKTLNSHKEVQKKFLLPKSWNRSLLNKKVFKKWAQPKLPIVIKSHYQHDKFNRFNFLIQRIEDVDIFCERYKQFLYYDVYIQEFIECDGIERKIYVIGDKVFGIKRENPIYKFLREQPEHIDVSLLKRENFDVSEDIKNLSKILSTELNLKIFGFDLVQPLDRDCFYLIDLNDFPSFKGIPDIVKVLNDFIKDYIFNL